MKCSQCGGALLEIAGRRWCIGKAVDGEVWRMGCFRYWGAK